MIVDGTLEIAGDVTVGTLHTRPGSILRVRPGSRITIADTPPCDAEEYGTGLVLEGRVEIAGTPKTAWTRLTKELQPGDVTLSADDVSGWRVGDRLVLADSREFGPALQGKVFAPEVVTVSAIAGKSVTFNPAVTHEYPCRRDNASVCESFGPVGNLSRDIVLRSQNPNGRRGHVMVTGEATGFIKDASFVDLGRTKLGPLGATNVKGRYALHLHMLHGTGFLVDGAVVERGTLWGPTVHGTNGHTVSHTVTFDVLGAGIMTEDGTETDNVISDNLVVLVTGTGDRGDGTAPDPGRHGACVWLQGEDNIVRRNVVANCGFGYSLWAGSQLQNTGHGRIREFAGNEAVSTWIGLTDWYLDGGDITRFMSWHSSGYDVYAYPTSHVTYTDLIVRGDPRQMQDGYWNTGWWAGDYETNYGALIRPDIRNKRFGITPPFNQGNHDPGGVGFTIDHPTLANWIDIKQETPYSSGGPQFVSAATKTTVVSPRHLQSAVAGTSEAPRAHYQRGFYPRSESNLLTLDQMTVLDYQGSGQSYRLWYKEQAGTFVIPSHASTTDVAGKTNAQAWSTAGKAIAGAVAPNNAAPMSWLTGGLASSTDGTAPDPIATPAPSTGQPTSEPTSPSTTRCRFPLELGLCR